MKTYSYQLENLDCANCAAKIERNIQKLKGIENASVSFATKMLYVELESEATSVLTEIKKLIHELEPDVEIIEKKSKHSHQQDCGGHDHACDCQEEHDHHEEHEVKHAELKLRLQGLDCANCAAKIERKVQELSVVKDASVTFSTEALQVQLRNPEQQDEVIKVITKLIKDLEPDVKVVPYTAKKAQEEEKKPNFFKENYKLVLGTIIFLIAIMLKEKEYAVIIYLISFLLIGGKVILTALRNILKGDMFDENFLMSVATIGAFIINDYAEAITVMLFYGIGEIFQSYAVNRSRKSISSLMNIRADYANVWKDGKESKVDPEEVKHDDIILIKPGERVPLDGIIIEGTSSLDTSALTGESMPRDMEVGDEILAGSVNLNKVIKVRVMKEASESTVARILELVENASSKKAPMEKFITKFARIYTPIVVALAVLIAILPPLFGSDIGYQEWIYRALTFLVVSCPCALVVSIPLGLFAGIGGASKQGILIKGGNYLEALKDVDCVVFDKTGTLTKGSFKVIQIAAEQADKVLELAAYGEFYSSHPIAVSIRDSFGKEIDTTRIENYEEIAGNGIQVSVDGHEILLGNDKLMTAHNIVFTESKAIGTIVHVVEDNKYLGHLVIADEIKKTSALAIQNLKAVGVKQTVMLTGDREEAAQAVAQALKLDKVYAQLLPQDKVMKVEELLEREESGKKLIFVGDGINDAPVLARADLGVAMGGIGSDAAIEAADIVLMKDDPSAIATAIEISKKTKKILWQNILLSLGIKAVVLILTAFGMANMWMGVFADVGVTLIAILNSMRALRIR